MNAIRPTVSLPTAARAAEPAARPERRERDFGIGYGRSSGYASVRRYAPNWAPPRFRFV